MLREVTPSRGVAASLKRESRKVLADAYESARYWVTAEYKRQLEAGKQGKATALNKTVRGLSNRWNNAGAERFQAASARWSKRLDKDVTKRLDNVYKKAGLTIRSKFTPLTRQRLGAVEELLNHSMLGRFSKFFDDIAAVVLKGFAEGTSANDLIKTLDRVYKAADKQVGNMALSLADNGAHCMIRTHDEAAGFTKAIWIHISGKKTARQTHVEMDGQEFDLKKGLYDREAKQWVLPGQLPWCRCNYRLVIPDWAK